MEVLLIHPAFMDTILLKQSFMLGVRMLKSKQYGPLKNVDNLKYYLWYIASYCRDYKGLPLRTHYIGQYDTSNLHKIKVTEQTLQQQYATVQRTIKERSNMDYELNTMMDVTAHPICEIVC